ncbi:MAG: hypothetical protein P1V97_18790 [Planctomycetota bacterium]|nr:hypothetical protein [Planctomycetota bacterium]
MSENHSSGNYESESSPKGVPLAKLVKAVPRGDAPTIQMSVADTQPTKIIAAPIPIKAKLIRRSPVSNIDEDEIEFTELASGPSLEEPSIEGARGEEKPKGALRRLWYYFRSFVEIVFGGVSLIIGLAALAVIPIVQFISLGYFFDATRRVAESGRFRDGFVGLRKAARIGSVVLGTWLVIAPLRFLSSLYVSAQIIEPGGSTATTFGAVLFVLTILGGLHIFLAMANGGRLRNFFWPVGNMISFWRRMKQGAVYGTLRDEFWDFLVTLRPQYYFWLGFRGFFASLIWLIIPITLLAASSKAPPVGFVGALLLMWVVMVLPFLQANFALENKFRAHFALKTVREHFRHAPFAFTFALLISLLFPVPLYLLKVELVPSEAGWLPSLFFITFMFPARLMTGWAYGRAVRREERAHFFWRFLCKPALLPMAMFYTVVVFASQYISWEGIASLYGQHAFLLPVPFFEFGNY